MAFKTCPTCGNRTIARQTADVSFTVRHKTTVVKKLQVERCEHCGEVLFDHEANQKVEKTLYKAKRSPRRKPA
jgi:YgiT-type zinc finger domain-containing protein